MNTLKAISIHQPYADLITLGFKRVENRTWSTEYRGFLLIHASKASNFLTKDKLTKHTTGAIIGCCELVDCIPFEDANDAVRQHKYAEGPVCWLLTNAMAIEPVPFKGAQRLFDVPHDAVYEALERASIINE